MVITEIDFDEMVIRGELAITLIVNDSFREGNSITYHQRRWPDTLRMTNGVFEVGFSDVRENSREFWEAQPNP